MICSVLNRLILTLTVLVSGMVCSAADDSFTRVSDQTSFLSKLAARTSDVNSIYASVTQEKFLSVFSAKVVSKGVFAWERDGRICLDYNTPSKYKVVISGDRLSTVADGRVNTMTIKGNPMMSQMGVLISSCMTGDLQAMDNGFAMEYFESDKAYKVVIMPSSKQIRDYISKMVILFDKKDLSVDSLEMYENESDYTCYIFTEKKFNEKIPDSVFAVR